jgi:hypothetical protein
MAQLLAQSDEQKKTATLQGKEILRFVVLFPCVHSCRVVRAVNEKQP